MNEWDAAAQGVKLPTLLEGEALAIWMELTSAQQKDYKEAKKKIIKKMAPADFVSLEHFQLRKLRPGESLTLYLHDLKHLLEQAMPDLDDLNKKQLLLHQFLAGLPAQLATQLQATGDVD